MADDLDAMLQGNDNPSASSAQGSQQGDSTQVNPIEQPTEEEVEFNKLDGKSQDRFKAIWARAREAEAKLEAERQTRVAQQPAAPGLQPDQKTAIETLHKLGLETADSVDAKLAAVQNQLRWDNEQQKLESKYTGRNGEPQYVREEVEDYIGDMIQRGHLSIGHVQNQLMELCRAGLATYCGGVFIPTDAAKLAMAAMSSNVKKKPSRPSTAKINPVTPTANSRAAG